MREWLNAQAAGGYVTYDPSSGRYGLPPEQAVALTDPDSPAYLPGFALGSVIDSPKIAEKARSGDGFAWHEHVHDVHEGGERFFHPGYNAHLIAEWLPALDGVVEKLERGSSSRTSVAVTAPRRSSWRRPSRTRRSSAPTTTRVRSRPRGSGPAPPG